MIPSWWWRDVTNGKGNDFNDFDSLLEIQPLLVTAPPGSHDDYFVLSYAAEVESEQHAMLGVITNDQFRNHAMDAAYTLSGDWIRDRRISFTFDSDDRFIPAAKNASVLPMISSQHHLMESLSVSAQFRVPEMRWWGGASTTTHAMYDDAGGRGGGGGEEDDEMEMNHEGSNNQAMRQQQRHHHHRDLPYDREKFPRSDDARTEGAPNPPRFAPPDVLPKERHEHHHVDEEEHMIISATSSHPRFVYRRVPLATSAATTTTTSGTMTHAHHEGNQHRLDENWYPAPPPPRASLSSSYAHGQTQQNT